MNEFGPLNQNNAEGEPTLDTQPELGVESREEQPAELVPEEENYIAGQPVEIKVANARLAPEVAEANSAVREVAAEVADMGQTTALVEAVLSNKVLAGEAKTAHLAVEALNRIGGAGK